MEKLQTAMTLKEAKFDINELFFSITDQDSTIRSGNEVFIRISGYRKDELIGSFHNIIRHPDMPKILFKTFWEYLQAGKPIVAYVKNKTKEGGYYWVLAAVFPLNDRYVSIRIKPNSTLFTAAKELYFKLLMAETKENVEASDTLLPQLLSELGYTTYDHFMSDILLHELQERQKVISYSENESQLESPLTLAYSYSKTLMKEYDRWFDKIEMFSQVKSMFEEKGMVLRLLAREIVFLSLNASVSSYKIENGGETFGVLARDIRINAKENDALIDQIHRSVEMITLLLNEVIFSVSTLRLQIEMVLFFLEEVLHNSDEFGMNEIVNNMNDLVVLVINYTDKLNAVQTQLETKIQETLINLDQLEQQMMYLGYVQIYGIIEAAASQDESARFQVIFSQLKTLVQQTSHEIETMQKMGASFYSENRILMEKSAGIEKVSKLLKEEILILQRRK
ncbi:MAG: PAS domain-containing protein [Pseudomonadota bacterium]